MQKKAALFIGVLFLASSPTSSSLAAPGINTEAFLASCFKQYVVLTDLTPETAREKASSKASVEKLKELCLTSNFRGRWNQNLEDTDADPLLNAQDIQESWKTHARVEILDTKQSSAKIILGTKAEEYCLQVSLKKTGSLWKIDSSMLCQSK